MKKLRIAALLFSMTMPLAGCIAAREYRKAPALTPLQVPPKPDATEPSSIAKDDMAALPVGIPCGGHPMKLAIAKNDGHDAPPCIAFVEYADADKTRHRPAGAHYDEQQIEAAKALVRQAIQDDPSNQPVIVGFVHGWKHSANSGDAQPGGVSKNPPEDSNIQGFEHILNFLYHCYYLDPGKPNPCLGEKPESMASHAGPSKIQGHVVVGIYFAWHGANVSPFWPVAQQLTVYSRGDDADNVGGRDCVDPTGMNPHGDRDSTRLSQISKDLEALSEIAHPQPIAEKEPMFVLVGHSFGARLLEQAICEPMKQRIDQQIAAPPGVVPNFADLVLFVNSAAPAYNGIEMLNFLSERRILYRKSVGNKSDQPLMAAITTPADAATGIAFTLAMYPKSQTYKKPTSITVFDPHSHMVQSLASVDSSKLIRNTLGHMAEFQSHSFQDIGSLNQDHCKGVNPNTFDYWVPGHCFEVKPAKAMSGQNFRWNGTPYWILSTDQSVIPDHGTIFTNRLLRLIGHFLPDETAKATVIQDNPPIP